MGYTIIHGSVRLNRRCGEVGGDRDAACTGTTTVLPQLAQDVVERAVEQPTDLRDRLGPRRAWIVAGSMGQISGTAGTISRRHLHPSRFSPTTSRRGFANETTLSKGGGAGRNADRISAPIATTVIACASACPSTRSSKPASPMSARRRDHDAGWAASAGLGH